MPSYGSNLFYRGFLIWVQYFFKWDKYDCNTLTTFDTFMSATPSQSWHIYQYNTLKILYYHFINGPYMSATPEGVGSGFLRVLHSYLCRLWKPVALILRTPFIWKLISMTHTVWSILKPWVKNQFSNQLFQLIVWLKL